MGFAYRCERFARQKLDEDRMLLAEGLNTVAMLVFQWCRTGNRMRTQMGHQGKEKRNVLFGDAPFMLEKRQDGTTAVLKNRW